MKFILESDKWKKEEDLENIKEAITKFERRLSVEVR